MADLSIASYYSFSIQLRKTSLDTLALLNRERAGRIFNHALLKTGLLAAELACAVEIWRARGLGALNCVSKLYDIWHSISIITLKMNQQEDRVYSSYTLQHLRKHKWRHMSQRWSTDSRVLLHSARIIVDASIELMRSESFSKESSQVNLSENSSGLETWKVETETETSARET